MVRTPPAASAVCVGFSALCLVGISVLPALSADTESISAESKIDRVMVFPSGAEVTRLAKIKLEPGDHAIVFEGLPAQAIGSSIRVEATATGQLEIGSVDTRRKFLDHDDQAAVAAERKAIEEQIEKLVDERTLLEGDVRAGQTQKTLLSNLANLPNRPPAAGTGGSEAGENWSGLVALIGTGLSDIEQKLLAANVKIRETNRQINDLQNKLNGLAPRRQEVTEVKVFAKAAAPLEADFTIRYQVPSASWQALYTARLSTGSKTEPPKLDLTRLANIRQNSGEGWMDAAISLSTTRPKAGTDSPELGSLTVDFEPERKPPPAPVAMAPEPMMDAMPASRGLAMAEREQGGYGRNKVARVRKVTAQVAQANVVAAPFQAVFEVPGRVSVDATGTAKRVQISQDTIEPKLGIRTVPKVDAKAYLFAEMSVPKGAPLLPGQVSLFRDGTYVGDGRLPMLAGLEDHKLGFGIDDLVRVRYSVSQEKQGESGLISSSRTDNRGYLISVKNLHERAMNLTVLDQVPVSKNQEIEVELTGKTAPTKKDVDNTPGLLAWEMKIGGDEERILDFGYRVRWPAAKKIEYGR